MKKKDKTPMGVEFAKVSQVRPTHEQRNLGCTENMTLQRNDTLVVTYVLDVLGRDLFSDREAAIEMYAQMAASRMRQMLSPIKIT